MQYNRLILAIALSAGLASAEDQWPQFRGPGGDGHAAATGLPVTWSENENIAWKVAIHDRGWSSPVVWEDQIWMTTATADGKRMFAVCVDRESGRVVHDVTVLEGHQPEEIHALNSYASPTPVVEAGRVYVHFGTYGTVCLDTKTARPLWARRDLKCNHFRGPGSSPVLWKDLLLLTFDGFDVQYLVGLDKRTGETVWKTDRSTDFGSIDGDLRKAYCTPLVVEVGGRPQMIIPGAGATMAYDPATGREIWKVVHKGYSTASRPLFGLGMTFINTGFDRPELWAVRPDGRGDVSESHVVWRFDRGVPCKPSPVLVDDLIYMVDDKGVLSCLEAASGELVWRARVEGQYSASPLYADGRIYLCNHDEATTVIQPGREFKVLAVNKLDDGCMASPAAIGKAIYLRTRTCLYRIQQ